VHILPPAPRTPSNGRLVKKLATGAFLGLLGLGMTGGMGFYSFTIADDLIEDRALYASGVSAPEAEIDGTSRTRRALFHEYKLTLRYTDKKGQKHTATESFDTMFGEVDKDEKVEIHYDAAHPGRAVSSWAVDVTVSRAVWAFVAALMSALGAFLLWATGKLVRDAFLERVAVREGHEVRVRLVQKSRDQYGNTTYDMTTEIGPGQYVTSRVTVPAKRSPWWLPGTGHEALGLYSERLKRSFLVDDDGQPVALSSDELLAARQRAQAGG
jgi:hypothetical protein